MNYTCTKCGKLHGMGIENRETGEITPMDVCYDCLWFGTYVPLTKQISFEYCDNCKNELVACVCVYIENDKEKDD